MSALANHIRTLNARGEKALGMFITSGFPSPGLTPELLRTIDEAGADFIELGMPFSDPLAEGLPIQHSSEVALNAGIRMKDTLAFARDFTAASDTPLVLMGYGNPIMRYGISNFFSDARSSGVQGVILPDVMPDADSPFVKAAAESGIDMICLVSPTTPDERLAHIDSLSSGFVYAVSVTGVTGTDTGQTDPIKAYLRHARTHIKDNPLLVGFGIRTPDDVRSFSEAADGAIVGSALVGVIREQREAGADDQTILARVHSFVHELKQGTLEAVS